MKTPFRDSIVRPAGIAGAAMMVAGTLWVIVTKSWAFPYMDEWDLVYAIDRLFDSGRFAEFFFDQHNEHRIVFPRIVFMVDYLWFRGSNQDFHFDPGTATVYTHAARIPRLSALNPAHQLRRQAPKPVRPLTDVDGTG